MMSRRLRIGSVEVWGFPAHLFSMQPPLPWVGGTKPWAWLPGSLRCHTRSASDGSGLRSAPESPAGRSSIPPTWKRMKRIESLSLCRSIVVEWFKHMTWYSKVVVRSPIRRVVWFKSCRFKSWFKSRFKSLDFFQKNHWFKSTFMKKISFLYFLFFLTDTFNVIIFISVPHALEIL